MPTRDHAPTFRLEIWRNVRGAGELPTSTVPRLEEFWTIRINDLWVTEGHSYDLELEPPRDQRLAWRRLQPVASHSIRRVAEFATKELAIGVANVFLAAESQE